MFIHFIDSKTQKPYVEHSNLSRKKFLHFKNDIKDKVLFRKVFFVYSFTDGIRVESNSHTTFVNTYSHKSHNMFGLTLLNNFDCNSIQNYLEI